MSKTKGSAGDLVRAVRLENFGNDAWQGPLGHRIFPRYPGARIMLRRPHVVVVELRTSSPWSKEDEEFFAAMWREGYVQRWEPLSELPPRSKSLQTVYEEIGYRIGSGERLTPRQQEELFTSLHAYEERAMVAEQTAEEQRLRAELAEEHTTRAATTYNSLVEMLSAELALNVYGDGEGWLAEDAATGKVLARGATLAEVYRAVLRDRLDASGGKPS